MELLEFKNYFLFKKRASIPELQSELSISYREIHYFIGKLLQFGIIKSVDELYYELDEHRLDTPRIYVFLLYQCIQTEDDVFNLDIKHLNLSEEVLKKANQWMLDQGYLKKNPFCLNIIDIKEFLLRYSEYLPFSEEQPIQMDTYKEKAHSVLWDYIEANPDVNYADFKRYCVNRAVAEMKSNPSLSSEFISFLGDYKIHNDTSFYLCKKQGRH